MKKVEVEIGLKDHFSDEYRNTVQEVDKASASLEEQMQKTSASCDSLTGSVDKNTDAQNRMLEALHVVVDELEKLNKAQDDTKAKAEDLGEKVSEAGKKGGSGFGKIVDGASSIPGPVGDAASSVKSLTKASLRFIATPLGAVLAAISAALATVTSWFSRTEEGQNALRVGSAYFTQTLESLLDVVDNVGEFLYKAFTKPQEALNSLWSSLKNKLMADMKRFAEMGQGIVEIFSGNVSEGMAKVNSAWSNIGVGGAVRSFMKDNNEAASRRVKLAERQNVLDKQEREFLVEKAKKEKEINELRAKAIDQTVSKAERAKAIKDATAKTNELYDKELSIARERYNIIRETNKLSHSNKQDLDKEAQAEAELYKIESQRSSAQRTLTRQTNSLSRTKKPPKDHTAEKDAASRQKLFDLEMQELERQAKEREALESANADLVIASEEDAAKRELLQRSKDHKDRINSIRKQADEWKKEAYEAARKRFDASNKDKTRSFSDTEEGMAGWQGQELNSTQRRTIELQLQKENAEYNRYLLERKEQMEQSMNDYLKDYGTYEEKKLAITKEFEKKITDAEKAGDKGAAMSLQKQMDEALSNLDFEQLKKDIDWEYVFGDLENIPLDILDDVNEKLRKFKDTAKDLKPDEIKAVVEAMSKIETRLGSTGSLSAARSATQARKSAQSEYDAALAFSLSAKGDTAKEALAYQVLIDKTKKLTQAKKKEDDAWGATAETALNYAKALREIGEFIGGTIGDVLNLGASAIEAGAGMANGIQVFKNSMDSLQRSVAILAIIQAALQAVRIISDLLGDSEDQTLKAYVESMDRYIDLLKDDINDLNKAMGDTKNTMTETIDLYKEYVDLQKESASAIRSQSQAWLNSGASKGFLGIGSKSSEGVKIVKGIEDNMKSGNADVKAYFTEAYNTLMEYARKAGRDSLGRLDWIWSLTDDELRELAKNTKVMSALGTELGDSIRNYLEAINEVNDSEGLLFENLLSVDFDSFYEEFSDMISDMDNDSENFADNFGENLRQSLIKNMVADQYRSTLKEFYDQIGEMSKAGTLEDNIDWAKQRYKAIADEARKQVEDINKITGYNNEGDEDKSFLDTIRNSFQNLLSGTVDDIEAWSKDIRKAIAASVMEGLLLDKEYDDWAKEWGNKYSDLMNRYFSGAVDEDAYKQELDVLVKDFNDKTKVIEERGKEMMKGFAESLAEDDTFKKMTDSWASYLMDFNKTAKDWAEDIGRTMAQKVIDQFVKASMMQPLLDNLQDAFNTAMGKEGATLESVITDQGILGAIKEMEKAYPEIQKIVEKVQNAFGITKKESEETKHALSDLSDTLVSSLMDIDKTAEEFGKDIGRKLIEQMISTMVNKKYAKRIESIQQMWDGVLNGTSKNTLESVKREIVRLYKAIGNETKELTESLKDVLEAADPFDGWRSSLLSFLTDAEQDLEGFMKDIQKDITDKLIDNFVMEGFDEQMAAWNAEMKKILSSDSSPEKIASDAKDLQGKVAAYSEAKKEEADMWRKLMGVDDTDYSDQKASVNMADKATYDQFETYLGIATATMIGQEQGNAVRIQILQALLTMDGITSPGSDTAAEMRSILEKSNEHLLDIKKSNREILEKVSIKLDSIDSKLSRL